jgi:hypothetical protein
MRRLAVVSFLTVTALTQGARAEELLPLFLHDDAVTCLAYTVSDFENGGPDADPAKTAAEMVFFARLVAIKATPEDEAGFDARFAADLAHYRMLHQALDDPARRDEADMDLTGTAKFCWFQALAAEGGLYEQP